MKTWIKGGLIGECLLILIWLIHSIRVNCLASFRSFINVGGGTICGLVSEGYVFWDIAMFFILSAIFIIIGVIFRLLIGLLIRRIKK